jgi:dipeptidase
MDPYKLPNNITFDDLKPLCSTTLKKQAKKLGLQELRENLYDKDEKIRYV